MVDAAICVVDDDVAVRNSLQSVIASLGYPVAVFESAEELLDSSALARARCLVLDVWLPGLSGTELYGSLLEAGRAPPVIFMSGHDDERVKQQALASGAVAFLQKPFADSLLIEALQRAQIPGRGVSRT